MMPGQDGYDLTKEIKKDSKVPIILLTAKGEVENRIKGLELGADDYLGKCLVGLKNSTNTRSAKFFRIINEIPTVILIIVVFLAIFKPI